MRRRYGDFVIEVTDNPDETAVRLGLAGARGTAPAWDQRLDGSWAATKRYGNDLFLIWRAEARGRLDERWRRIDAVMERVAQRTGQPAGASSSR